MLYIIFENMLYIIFNFNKYLVRILPTKYLLNIKIYLFDTKN